MSTTAVLQAPAPEHIEKAHQAAVAKSEAANAKVEGFNLQINAAKSKIAALTADYNASCRDLAAGKPADPGSIRSQIDLVTMRVAGLEEFHREAIEAAAPLVAESQRAWNAVRAGREAAIDAQLTADLVNRERARDMARAAFEKAELDVSDAVNARSSFRVQLENTQRRREHGLES